MVKGMHYGILFVNGLVPTRQNKILNLDIMLKLDKEKLWAPSTLW